MIPKQEDFDRKYNVRMPRTNGVTMLNSQLALNSLEKSYHEIDRMVFFSDKERLELSTKIRSRLLELSILLNDNPIDEDNRETVKYIAFLISKLDKARNKDDFLIVINEKLNEVNNKIKKGTIK